MKKKLNILVVGGGMYVIGNNANNFGTIMPALLEPRRNDLVDRIAIVTTNTSSVNCVSSNSMSIIIISSN